jgi:DNA polymerase III subunit alpha
VVTEVARQISKRDGSEWARITVEDFYGTATVLAFGDTFAQNRDALVKDAPVLLRGGVSGRERDEEDPPIFLDGIVKLESLRQDGQIGICIELGSAACEAQHLQQVKELFTGHPGSAPVTVLWRNGGTEAAEQAPRLRSRSFRIDPQPELVAELRATLGDTAVKLVRG